jgi:hypothetical protein
MPHQNSRHGGVISGLLFAGLVVFTAMFLVGLVAIQSIHVRGGHNEDGSDVAIDTPGGRLSIRTRDHMNPAVAGIPVYPGAYRADDGGAHIEWTSQDGAEDKNLYVVGGEFRTKDPAWKVVDFYRGQLPSVMIVSRSNRGTRLEYKDGGIQRIISIDEREGETHIGVASIAGRASN